MDNTRMETSMDTSISSEHHTSLLQLENLVDQIGTDHPFDTITELIEEVLVQTNYEQHTAMQL